MNIGGIEVVLFLWAVFLMPVLAAYLMIYRLDIAESNKRKFGAISIVLGYAVYFAGNTIEKNLISEKTMDLEYFGIFFFGLMFAIQFGIAYGIGKYAG